MIDFRKSKVIIVKEISLEILNILLVDIVEIEKVKGIINIFKIIIYRKDYLNIVYLQEVY